MNTIESFDDKKGRCYGCFLSKKACLCKDVTPFEVVTKFIILMHPKEFKRERTGTGKITSSFLLDSEVISGVNFDHNSRVNELLNDERFTPFILYPGKKAMNLSTPQGKQEMCEFISKKHKNNLIFVIDGTWACAKTMMRESTCLHTLPRVAFTPQFESQFHIKAQPHKHCLSTIESVYSLVKELEFLKIEKPAPYENMLSTFNKLNEFLINCARDPSLSSYQRGPGYKTKEERSRVVKKWTKYSVFYNE